MLRRSSALFASMLALALAVPSIARAEVAGADEPSDAPPPTSTPTAPAVEPDAPAESATAAHGRDHGVRLGADIAYGRRSGGEDGRLNDGEISIVPFGVALDLRTSETFLVGLHGYAAMAGRDDCYSASTCGSHDIGFGAHLEYAPWPVAEASPWIRYGMGYEVMYRRTGPYNTGPFSGGPESYEWRRAFDLLDLRIGVDFTLATMSHERTIRLGPYLGMLGGVDVGTTYGTSNGPGVWTDDRPGLLGHLWFVAGVRSTFDP